MTTDESTKHRIMLAAGPIFAKQGFRGATVREISDAAGVNLASVNYYFGDKQQLYIDTVFLARQLRVEQVPLPRWDQQMSAADKLESFVSMLLNRMVAFQSVPWQVRLLMREILQPTEACRQLVEEYFRPFLESLMTIIDEVIGHKLPDFRRRQIAFSIVGQCMYYRFAGEVASMLIGNEEETKQHFEIQQLTKHVTQFSLGALQHIRQHELSVLESSSPRIKTNPN